MPARWQTGIDVRPEIREALRTGKAVVALESTLIAHGLPWPLSVETASAAEAAVRQEGGVPATIAVLEGCPTIGLTKLEVERLANAPNVLKASRRDLATAVSEGLSASTTVAATMALAHQAGIAFFATGGIGGAQRGPCNIWDVSADILELARTPVAVVCAGAKSILDLRRTLELLESYGVPVLGYATNEFPAFFLRGSGEPVSSRVEDAERTAALLRAHWGLAGAGVVIAQPLAGDQALEPEAFEQALQQAEELAMQQGIRGKEVTPFLLAHLAEFTGGKSLRANQALVVQNAALAARLAVAFGRLEHSQHRDCPPL